MSPRRCRSWRSICRKRDNEVTYSLATATDLQGLTDLASSGAVPAMAMQDGSIRLTHSLHQEVSIQRKMAGLQLEAAYFYDHFVDPILNGYGDASAAEFSSGDVLLDPVTGAFRSVGPNYSGGGFRVFAARQLKGNCLDGGGICGGTGHSTADDKLRRADFVCGCIVGCCSNAHAVGAGQHAWPNPWASGTTWNAGYRWQPEANDHRCRSIQRRNECAISERDAATAAGLGKFITRSTGVGICDAEYSGARISADLYCRRPDVVFCAGAAPGDRRPGIFFLDRTQDCRKRRAIMIFLR